MMVFLVRERGAENIEKMEKIDKRKTLKNEEKEKQIIRGKSNKNKRLLKTVVHTITFYLQLSPSKRIKDRIKGGTLPTIQGLLLHRHIYNGFSVYLFLEFQP